MTPKLQQAIASAQALSSSELLELLGVIVEQLRGTQVVPSIQKTANVCGGDARIRNTRIPVWVLVQARALGCTDADILQNYPMLSLADLANAWAYAAQNSVEVERAIRENDAA
ncbi:MAG: DUF433 domain-containing protein [Synechococcales cyanobacterium CRU_2_2]|nr:DUF433 domain-containing protein [Synechococcales cyanobacterium CRU_2_2]